MSYDDSPGKIFYTLLDLQSSLKVLGNRKAPSHHPVEHLWGYMQAQGDKIICIIRVAVTPTFNFLLIIIPF